MYVSCNKKYEFNSTSGMPVVDIIIVIVQFNMNECSECFIFFIYVFF